jgi:aryl-alcohol dehydrogenase-like predicted oxidoreductase
MSQPEVPKDLPEMEYRFVGKSGLQISAISLGGWLTYGGHVGDDNTFACLKAAYDAGINFFDCAEGYAQGESEKVMGRAIKHFGWTRSDIVVSTKVAIKSNVGAHQTNTAYRSTGARTTLLSLVRVTR